MGSQVEQPNKKRGGKDGKGQPQEKLITDYAKDRNDFKSFASIDNDMLDFDENLIKFQWKKFKLKREL